MNRFSMNRPVALAKLAARLMAIASLSVLLAATSFQVASAQPAPSLGSASGFAALSGTAVTCTDSALAGDIGVWPGTAVTQTNCVLDGTVHAGDDLAAQAYIDFLSAYNAFAVRPCDFTLTGDLGGLTLDQPGVYCVDAASTTTNGVLMLVGSSDAVWIFKIGTSGTGALTGTGLTVDMMGGGLPCNVYWWVAEAATVTDSAFQGTILAGAAVTVTGGTFDGDVLAQAGVTLTGASSVACEQSANPGPTLCKIRKGHGHHHKDHGHHHKGKKSKHERCDQGVGNGSEDCDPGHSNHGDDDDSNDEKGGLPGDPGRRGGHSRS